MSEPITVCRLDEVEPGAAIRCDVDGHRLAVIRFADDEVYVLGDKCSHDDYSLAEGEVDTSARTIECWKHGSTFSVDNGEPGCLPAIKPVPTYVASVVDGEIRIEVSERQT